MGINPKLKVLRIKKNVRQRTIAKFLNITVASYSRKENGTRNFTIDEAAKVAEFFNATMLYIEVGFKKIFIYT